MEIIKKLFRIVLEKEASDLFLRTNALPRIRVNGKLQIAHPEPISRDAMISITNFLLANEARKRKYAQNLDIEFIHEEPDMGRFRINIFTQRQTSAIVARYVHSRIRSFEELSLPIEICRRFCEESRGLVLLCGPAGNGKSTTIASMLQFINHNSAKHIVTIEDPIEFLFEDDHSIINQRELGLDVYSYPQALKHVTQQSPDIIFIGNIRDEETMRAAIAATELGVFVLSTFHTINAVQTIVRIINFFPPHLHDEVRMQLSMILKGVVSLRLLPRQDGTGRIPAYETLVVTPTISRLIREGSMKEIQSYIDEGQLFGMMSFKRCLVNLVHNDLVDGVEAQKFADSKDDFVLELKGIKRMQ